MCWRSLISPASSSSTALRAVFTSGRRPTGAAHGHAGHARRAARGASRTHPTSCLRGFVVESGLDNGIEVTDGTDCEIVACEVRNLRRLGIRVDRRLHAPRLRCDIHHTGQGGLVLGGGDRKTLTPAGHEAINNHIWRFSRAPTHFGLWALLRGRGQPGRAQPHPRCAAPGRLRGRQRPRLRIQRGPPRLHRNRRLRRPLQRPQPVLPRQPHPLQLLARHRQPDGPRQRRRLLR